jgi:glycosyltransferase involved in cell wall biosynthesis
MNMGPIAIDYTPAVEQGAGIGRYVRELVAALSSQDKKTDYRLFIAGNHVLPEVPGRNFSWVSSRLSPEWHARLWHRARLSVPVERWTGPIKLYHATDFTLPPVHEETRTLLTVHDLSFIRAPESAEPGLRRYLESVVPRSIRRADHILADSESTRRDIIDLYGTAESKITVLYCGVEDRFYPVNDPPVLARVREKYGIGNRPYILSVGTVQPRKNYARLVEAFNRLNRPNLLLVIAGGKGWLEDPLYERIEQLNMSDRVHFTGFIDDADLPALYSGALLMAYPSLYEGFGLPPLEAMACGTPIVSSNTSSLPEVIGDAGIMVDPLDIAAMTEQIKRVLDNSELRHTLKTRGQLRVQRFNWQTAATQLRGQYEALLSMG